MIIEKLFKLYKNKGKKEDLISGLIFGLIYGLGFFINFFVFLGLASLISHYPSFIPVWILIVVAIIIFLVMDFSDQQKRPKRIHWFTFYGLKKLEALVETVVILGYLNLGRLSLKKLGIINWNEALKWTGYIGAGLIILAIAIGIIIGLIWLNYKIKELDGK